MRVSKSKEQSISGILSASTWSKDFLKRFLVHCKDSEYFTIGASGTIIQWCVEYYNEYKEAPGYHLMDIYEKNIRLGKIKRDDVELVESALSVAMADKTDRNIEFLINESTRLDKVYHLNTLKDDLESAIEEQNFKRVEEILAQKRAYEESRQSKSIDPFRDDYAISCVFARSAEPLFHMKGGLGELLNNHLKRDSLIAILAPEKRGKSQVMMELAMRAVLARCNVAMFQVGDLSDYQFFRRMWSWLSGKTADEWRVGHDRKVPIMDCLLNQNNTCVRAGRPSIGHSILDASGTQLEEIPANYRPCVRCYLRNRDFKGAVTVSTQRIGECLTEDDCISWRQALSYRTKGRRFKVSTHSNSTVNVADINNILLRWKNDENFEPELIVIDYADILAPENAKKDSRDIQDERWRALRRLSQDFNCLVVTATQAAKKTYTAANVTSSDQSEDKRKNAHLTGMLGLHQVVEEKINGVMRISWLMLREGDFDPNHQAVVLQDLSAGQPHIDSYLNRDGGKPLFRKRRAVNSEETEE